MPSIIALQACRHGTGCSHLTTNLATIFVQEGQRVGVLDTDPRSGGIRMILGIDTQPEPPSDHYWWLHLPEKSSLTFQFQALPYGTSPPAQQPGLYLVPATQGNQGMSNYLKNLQRHYGVETPSEALTQLQGDLQLDCLLIDTQPTLEDDNLLGLALADRVLLLLQVDNYDFQRVAVILAVLEELGDCPVWLVPSQVLPDSDEAALRVKLKNTYQLPVGGVLYLTEEMVHLGSRGVFSLRYPSHALTRTLREIATQVLPTAVAVSSSPGNPPQKSILSRRGRPLFGLLDLSPAQRRVLMTVIRQGTLTQQALIDQGLGNPEEVSAILQKLMDQGWIIRDRDSEHFRYQSPDYSSSP